MKTYYYVETWDVERQEWSPQPGVRTGPYTLFGLRKAMRKLRAHGYECRRHDPSVLVSSVRVRHRRNLAKTLKRIDQAWARFNKRLAEKTRNGK